MKIKVWTLAWDTCDGIGCTAYATESERDAAFRAAVLSWNGDSTEYTCSKGREHHLESWSTELIYDLLDSHDEMDGARYSCDCDEIEI